MKMIPLGRQYRASVVNTDLDVYKIKDKVMGVRTSNHPGPFQISDKLGIIKDNDTKTRIVVYNSKGLFYLI
jgi:hypothetical protein